MAGQPKSKTIGIIGLGSIGSRHARNLKALGHKTAGYDPDDSKSEICDVFCYDKVEGLFELNLNGIIVASPTFTHASYAIDVIQNNTPCFVEKPIGGSEVRFGEFPQKYLKQVLMVGYNLRFHSCVKAAKKWIDDGFLGQPLRASFDVGQYNDRYADGVILNWSHEIDLALYLLGPGRVSSSSTRISNGRDDISDILLTHHNGCRSYVHLDYITQPEIRQSLIVGSEATIIFDLVHREAWLRSKDEIMLDHQGFEGSFDADYAEEMEAFIDRIDGKETIGCTGEEALMVLEICLQVRSAAGLT